MSELSRVERLRALANLADKLVREDRYRTDRLYEREFRNESMVQESDQRRDGRRNRSTVQRRHERKYHRPDAGPDVQ
jgi:hypothetical protein